LLKKYSIKLALQIFIKMRTGKGRKMKKSLKSELTIKVSLIAIIILTLISTLFIVDFRKSQLNSVKNEMRSLMNQIALDFNDQNKEAIDKLKVIANYQEAGGLGQRAETIKLLKKIIEENHNMAGIGVLYEPNADGQDSNYINQGAGYTQNGRYLPYWARTEDGVVLITAPGVDGSDFYELPKRDKKTIITEPYVYEGVMMVTYAEPIVINEQFKGIVGIDRSLVNYQQTLKELKFFKSAKLYMLSQENKFIATSDEDSLLNKNLNDSKEYSKLFAQLITSKNKKVIEDKTTGKFVAYIPIKSGNWKLFMTVDKAEILEEVNNATIKVIVISILGVIILATFLYLMINKSLNPLEELQDKIEDVANNGGDLTQRLDINYENEIGNLATSFNHLLSSLQEIMKDVLSESEEVASASQELSAASEEGNAVIETTTTNIEQMSVGINEISASTEEVSAFSEQTSQMAFTGAKNIEESINQIQTIEVVAKNSAEHMERLGTKAEEINGIISLITNIAEQTNLLALNAAIEAARAGEHGRGFAVVAEEIRQLAEETATATGDITELIRYIQHEAKEALEATALGEKEVSKGQEIINEAGKSFKKIVESINEMNNRIEQTSAATQQLASGSNEIVGATKEINEIISEVTNSSNQLAANSQKLQERVGKFKI
jgi:methyl-accepting chemotaxis protein